MSKRGYQLFLIKLGDGQSTQMGCSLRMLAINNHPVAFENIGEALIGLRNTPAQLTLEGQGTFIASDGRARIESLVASPAPEKAELYFDGGLRVRGEFCGRSLDFHGFINGDSVWNIVIESVGGCDVE